MTQAFDDAAISAGQVRYFGEHRFRDVKRTGEPLEELQCPGVVSVSVIPGGD